MQDEVNNVQAVVAPNDLRDIRARHTSSGIKDSEWNAFFRDFNGNVEEILDAMLVSAKRNRDGWLGVPPPKSEDPTQAYIQDSEDLEKITLARLEAEIARLQELVSVDKDTFKRFREISQKITTETELLRACNEKLADHEGAAERLNGLVGDRYEAYKNVFSALIAEESVLNELYAPIKARLDSASGTLNKLSFSVARTVDVGAWSDEGESLLNLAKKGPF